MNAMNEEECDDFGQNVAFCPKVLLFSPASNTDCLSQWPIWNMVKSENEILSSVFYAHNS